MTWWGHDAALISSAFPSALRWTVARVREQYAPDRGAVPRIVLDEPPPTSVVVAAPLRVEHCPRGPEEGLTATEAVGRVGVGARHRDDSREDRERHERREECPPPHRDRSLEARGDVRATLRLRRGKSMIRKLLLTALGSKCALKVNKRTNQNHVSPSPPPPPQACASSDAYHPAVDATPSLSPIVGSQPISDFAADTSANVPPTSPGLPRASVTNSSAPSVKPTALATASMSSPSRVGDPLAEVHDRERVGTTLGTTLGTLAPPRRREQPRHTSSTWSNRATSTARRRSVESFPVDGARRQRYTPMSGLPRGPYTVKIRATVTRIDDAEGAEGADARRRTRAP